MKKIGKKIGKYLILVLLSLIGLACIGVLYLFFVPGSNLFNITYISYSAEYTTKDYAPSSVTTVVLNSRSYNVNILATDDNSVSAKVYNNSFGFVLVQNKNVTITEKLTDKTLEITVNEPYGFAIPNNSYINLSIPKSYEIDLQLKNLNAKTNISSEGLKINDLTYETSNGNATLNSTTITGNLNLNLGNATFTVSNSTNSNTNVYLDLSTGKFNGSSATFGDITVNSNTRGIIQVKECDNFNIEIESAGGRVEIDKVSFADIDTSDTNVYINEVTDSLIADLTASGNIEVNTINGSSRLYTNNGNIKIKKANTSLIILETTYGNITISEAYNKIQAITNHGTINVTYAEDAEHHVVDSNTARSIMATIHGNGKVQVSGAESINVMIENNGRADVLMNDVVGENVITGNKGSVYVKINKDSKYKLKTTSISGSVRVNLTQVPEYNGYKNVDRETFVNCVEADAEASSNVFKIHTNTGSLTVLDTNF